MIRKLGFVAKVLALATLLAVLIKWGGPNLPIPASGRVSLGIVLLPSLVMAGVLGWRARRS